MHEIYLNTPKIEKNRITFSWKPNYLFKDSSYFVEYLNLDKINTNLTALTEAYLPICLSFCVLGNVTLHLPAKLSETTLQHWRKLFQDTARVLYKRKYNTRFVTPTATNELQSNASDYSETALLFGGGSESLLTLAYLREKNISPILASLWGSNWQGSNLELNEHRFELEEKISKEFDLRIFRIFTNFRTIFENNNFQPFLSRKAHFINSALFLPFNLSLLYPVAQQLNLKQIVSGNEQESSSDIGYYSLSSEMTRNLNSCSQYIRYYSYLEDLKKLEVVKNLHLQFPAIAKYQFSCWQSKHERWCLKCEKCLRNYAIYKIFNINPLSVNMEEGRLKKHLNEITCSIGYETVKNKAVRCEWKSMRHEAKKLGSVEVIKLINDLLKRFVLRKSFLLLRKTI